MGGSILGNRVLRKEDPKFLTTGGVYVDDMYAEPLLAGAAHVTFVRSQMAHATILGIDVSAALQAPGVIAVHTAASLKLAPETSSYNAGVSRTLLASDRVRYVGEPVAVVVTEQANQGEDAADLVVINYEPLEVLIDIEAAMTSSTLIYPDAGSNIVVDSTVWGMPDVTGDDFSPTAKWWSRVALSTNVWRRVRSRCAVRPWPGLMVDCFSGSPRNMPKVCATRSTKATPPVTCG
jgi:carbon-monoxide dehydrogenase large subunit